MGRVRSLVVMAWLCCSATMLPGCTPKDDSGARLSLTEAERQWLMQHPVLKIAPDPSFPPIEYLADDGTYHGLVADYFAILEQRLSCKFQVVPRKTWAAVLEAAQQREVDIVPAAQQTPERLAYLDFTSPLLDIPNVIISSSEEYRGLTFDKMSGMKVSVTDGYALHEYIRTTYPKIVIVPVASDLRALEDVSFHRVDAAVVNLAIASYLIRAHGFTNLRVAGDSHRSNALSIATRKDWPVLHSIMEKAIASLSKEERAVVYARWVNLPDVTTPTQRTVIVIGIGFLCFAMLSAGAVLMWNRSLRLRVSRKTAELNQELAEHRRMDKALRESEARWKFALEGAGDGIWDLNVQTKEVFVSQRWIELLGYTPSPGDIRLETWERRIHFEDIPFAVAIAKEQFDGKLFVSNIELRFLCSDGSYRWVLVRGKLMERDASGQPLRLLGVLTDVTESRRVRDAVVAAENKYHMIFTNATEGIFQTTESGEFLTVNPAAARIFGFATPEEFLAAGMNASTCYLDSGRRAAVKDALDTAGSIDNWESQVRRKDGSIIWISENMHVVRRGDGQISYYEGTLYDITRRKNMEEALRASEDKFAKAFRTSPDAVSISRVSDGIYLEVNDGFTQLTGYTSGEAVRSSSTHLRIWADEKERTALVESLQKTGVVNNREIHLRNKSGSIVVGLLSARFVDVDGEPCILAITRDITERISAEQEITILAQSLRSVGESVSITDMDDRLLFVNRAFIELYGYSETELIGQKINIVRAKSDTQEVLGEILSASRGGGWQGEVMNRKNDGTEFPVYLSTSVVKNKHDEPIALVGVARDVTEERRARNQINASLKEKEILLKEIHHRVKNNLQVISSLLNLQLASVRDPYDVGLFRESQNRIRSMAIIHEKLYQSDDLSHVDFGSYIGALSNSLFRSYDVSDIGFHADVESIRLAIDVAIPCGLIINELISNALKHAFPDGRRGRVAVAMHREDDGFCRIVVADDGKGFPADLDFRKTTSLGLELVNTLVDQLNGTIELLNHDGTTFSIRFPQQ